MVGSTGLKQFYILTFVYSIVFKIDVNMSLAQLGAVLSWYRA